MHGPIIISGNAEAPSKAARRPLAGLQSAVAQVSSPALGEESDAYPTIANLSTRFRVIACRANIQWILQKRRGDVDHWRGVWFCRTRQALVRGVHMHVDHIGGDALARLLRLPQRFGGTS
jgi:hypothetical protein